MKNIKLITYDLIKPEKDYTKLVEAIKSYGSYAHALGSVWFIDSNKSTGEIRDYLQQFVDGNDKVIVTGVNGWAISNISTKITSWLKGD
ncbi:CRISPR-associated protein Cas2 [Nanoarchaeota archaeon]